MEKRIEENKTSSNRFSIVRILLLVVAGLIVLSIIGWYLRITGTKQEVQEWHNKKIIPLLEETKDFDTVMRSTDKINMDRRLKEGLELEDKWEKAEPPKEWKTAHKYWKVWYEAVDKIVEAVRLFAQDDKDKAQEQYEQLNMKEIKKIRQELKEKYDFQEGER